jgi:hypothetical protein
MQFSIHSGGIDKKIATHSAATAKAQGETKNYQSAFHSSRRNTTKPSKPAKLISREPNFFWGMISPSQP